MLCPSCHTENAPAEKTCVTCHTALPAAEGWLLGGRYEIQSCLGKGGMGVVYKAYDRVLEETVAIKLLLGQDEPDSPSARRFRSEIKLARRVTHRNVCRIHDYGQDGGRPYISMQFMEGTDLRARVRQRGGLPAAEAVDIALQVADGLQAIHDEGIVHRDLKTANVMIDAQGVARLMDFGIAKAAEGGESLTGTGHIVGTPEYMSPEQIHAHPLDARSDVYSLGVILFELFTGRVPFSAGTAVGVLMKHLHDEPPLDEVAVPPAVRAVIRRALAKEREARYASARELAQDLRTATAPAAEPQPAPEPMARKPVPLARPTHGSPGRVAALVLGLAIVIPLGLWAAYRAVLLFATAPSPLPSAPPETFTASVAPSSVLPAPPATTTPPAIETPALGLEGATRACNEGQAAACSAAGQRHEAGDGTARDEVRAAALYRRACTLGSAAGCTRLGVLHNSGRGVEKDVAGAAELYEKGCTGGDGAGCNNLGTMYEFGVIGFAPDTARAAGYYRRACDLRDAPGCGNLGIVTLGPGASGAARDEAIRLLRQGCSGGGPRACRKLQDLGLGPY